MTVNAAQASALYHTPQAAEVCKPTATCTCAASGIVTFKAATLPKAASSFTCLLLLKTVPKAASSFTCALLLKTERALAVCTPSHHRCIPPACHCMSQPEGSPSHHRPSKACPPPGPSPTVPLPCSPRALPLRS